MSMDQHGLDARSYEGKILLTLQILSCVAIFLLLHQTVDGLLGRLPNDPSKANVDFKLISTYNSPFKGFKVRRITTV